MLTKPPNILIYTGRNQRVYQQFQELFATVLEPDCYVVYPFEDKSNSEAWLRNTCLLVLTAQSCEEVLLNDYLQQGGKCLSLNALSPNLKSGQVVQLEECDWFQYETPNGGVAVYPAAPDNLQLESSLPTLLEKYFQMKCSISKSAPVLTNTVGYLVADDEKTFLRSISHCIQLDSTRLELTNDQSVSVCDNIFPVLYNHQPLKFDKQNYFQDLRTKKIGRVLFYSDLMDSTHSILEEHSPLPHGLAIVTRRQLRGRGRSGNVWISPEGCATFSLRIQFPLHSELGRHLPLLQHIVALAIVTAVKKLPHCQDLKVGVKWPNDIYFDGWQKIGGILVTTSIMGSSVTAAVGCGINLDNQRPTTCLNRIIEEVGGNRLSLETLLAVIFNELEYLIELVACGRIDLVIDLYHQNWLHKDAQVIVSDGAEANPSRILGIDDFGFLRVKKEDGFTVTVHPDGNSFDMLNGLVVPK